jgi:hypothetical protein
MTKSGDFMMLIVTYGYLGMAVQFIVLSSAVGYTGDSVSFFNPIPVTISLIEAVTMVAPTIT